MIQDILVKNLGTTVPVALEISERLDSEDICKIGKEKVFLSLVNQNVEKK